MNKESKTVIFIGFVFCAFILNLGAVNVYAATVSGKVVFEGEAPAPKPINFGAERQCALVHGGKAPLSEDLVVNQNGTLKWAFVRVKEGLASPFEVPKEPLEINQYGCLFEPHVS